MKKITLFLGAIASSFGISVSIAQTNNWVEMMQDPSVNFYTVQQAFEQYWADPSHIVDVQVPNPNYSVKWSNVNQSPFITKARKPGWKTFKRWHS